jgi:hypothetical protein
MGGIETSVATILAYKDLATITTVKSFIGHYAESFVNATDIKNEMTTNKSVFRQNAFQTISHGAS